MSCTTLGHALAGIALMVTAAGCHLTAEKSDPGEDGGAPTTSDAAATEGAASCYIDVQFVCEEDTAPTAEVVENLKVLCSSASGDFKMSLACPTTGFVGKCSFAEGKNTKSRRYYTGVDVAYTQDFCVNTAHGVWSTTF